MIPALLQYLKMPQAIHGPPRPGRNRSTRCHQWNQGSEYASIREPVVAATGELSQQSALYSAPIEPPKLESGTLLPRPSRYALALLHS